jgi:hypothetical protein
VDARGYGALVAATTTGAVAGSLVGGVRMRSVRRICPGGLIVAIDNRYVPGSRTPIARTDAQGNTYQLRRLADGSRHEVADLLWQRCSLFGGPGAAMISAPSQ